MSDATLDMLFFCGWLLSFTVLVGGSFGVLISYLERTNRKSECSREPESADNCTWNAPCLCDWVKQNDQQ